jgi:F-type H+-transporting ATPase subunit b
MSPPTVFRSASLPGVALFTLVAITALSLASASPAQAEEKHHQASEDMVGKSGEVKVAIPGGMRSGKVSLDEKLVSARSEKPIDEGKWVQVLAINDGALAVKKRLLSPIQEQLLRHLLNLTFLLVFLGWVLRKPVGDFLASRRLEVKEALDESWKSKTSAEDLYQEIEARIANFEGEIETLMEDVRSDADMERKSIEERAEQAAAQLESAAKRSVDEELRRALRELREQAISLAVGHASSLLSKSVSDDDQQRLTGDYLGKVGEVAKR